MDMIKIGKQIMKFRKAKGFTQEILAERLHISPQAISKWENGLTLPDTSVLIDLSNILDASIDDLLLQFNKNVKARYETVLLPYEKIGTYSGAGWPHSMSDASMLAALKLFLGLEEAKDDLENQLNNDDEYILQSAITGVTFGFSYSPVGQLRDAFQIYGLDFDIYHSNDYSEQQLIQLAKVQIDNGLPVIVQPLDYIDKILAIGYIDNGRILKGLGFLEGDDDKNSSIDFNKLSVYKNWYRTKFDLLLVKYASTRLPVDQAMIAALLKGYDMLKNTEIDEHEPLKGHGIKIYSNWIKLLQEDNLSNKQQLDNLFPHIIILYENKLRIMGFLEQCIQRFNNLDTIELQYAVHLFKIICDYGMCIMKIYKNESMQDKDIKEKRGAIINYLEACFGNENRAVLHIEKFIQSNGLNQPIEK